MKKLFFVFSLLLCGLALSPAAQASVLVEVRDAFPVHATDYGYLEVRAVRFSLKTKVSSIVVEADIYPSGTYVMQSPSHAYLTTRIGPGTSREEHQVAETIYTNANSSGLTILFMGVTLEPGEYYLVLAKTEAGGHHESWRLATGSTLEVIETPQTKYLGSYYANDPTSPYYFPVQETYREP